MAVKTSEISGALIALQAGYESMNMIRQGQIKNVERRDVLGQIKFIHSLFEIAV